MRKAVHIGALALLLAAPAAAQDYTIVTVSHADNLISEIDPVSGQTRQKFTVMPGEWAGETHEGCVTADGKTAYISIPYAKQVLVLDLATFKPKGTLESPYFTRVSTHTQSTSRGGTKESTSTDPHGVALSADESKLYVTVEFGEVPGVVAYDLKTGKSTKIDTVVMGNWLGVHPKTGMIFVPSRSQADNVTVIDTKTEKVIRAIPLKNGSRPAGVAFGGPNGEVWISGDGDGSISLIDSTSLKVVKVLQPKVKGGGRIAASPDGKFVASTAGREVSIIDTTTREIVASVPISPEGMAEGHGYPLFSPDGTKLHVLNESSGDMVTIDMKNMKAPPVRSAKIGNNSFGGGVRVLAKK